MLFVGCLTPHCFWATPGSFTSCLVKTDKRNIEKNERKIKRTKSKKMNTDKKNSNEGMEGGEYG